MITLNRTLRCHLKILGVLENMYIEDTGNDGSQAEVAETDNGGWSEKVEGAGNSGSPTEEPGSSNGGKRCKDDRPGELQEMVMVAGQQSWQEMVMLSVIDQERLQKLVMEAGQQKWQKLAIVAGQ